MRTSHPLVAAAIALAALPLFADPALAAHDAHAPAAEPSALPTPGDAAASLRDLWIGHVFWVRNVALETIAGDAEAAKVAEQQVVANARAIAASLEPFHGEQASAALFDLLAGHYGAVRAFLDGTVAKDASARDKAAADLRDNAAAISRFLSAANPNLPFDTLNGLLSAHGAHHVLQIDQLFARNYADEAQTWDAMKKHMYVIADALAAAIAKQFPEKFRQA